MADKKLSPEQQKQLDDAKAIIAKLTGDVVIPKDEVQAPQVLRRFRVLLHGVTWDEKTKKYTDCRTKGMVRDDKGDVHANIVIQDAETGRPKRVRVKAREVTIDRAVVEAHSTGEAWEKFRKDWGITNSDFVPQFVEVRTLTEAERAAPPKDVIEPEPNVLFGVPRPHVLPSHAEPDFPAPIIPVNGPLTHQEIVFAKMG